jgi:four helix bundle protein
MATFSRFEDLTIWQSARKFANAIFKVYTKSEPFSKDFKLKDQINGSSGSIMDNIAEGFERNGRAEFIQFLAIAKGSLGEVKSQLYRALDRQYINQETFEHLFNEADSLAKQIGGFIKYLNASEIKGWKYKERK